MAGVGDIEFKLVLRPCLVNGKKALFHMWEQYAIDDIEKVFGIIEDETGQVHRINPISVRFLDNEIENYYFDEEGKR